MNIEIKICGLTNVDDVKAAIDFGADYFGFILYQQSPRSITPSALNGILDKTNIAEKAIAVFVNESREIIEKTARDCGLYAVQLHGDEDIDSFNDMPVQIWRAVKYQEDIFVPDPEKWEANRYLIDAAVPGMHGGTGVIADWEESAKLAEKLPVMLGGGLTPDNVADAIRIVNPLGVDTASGVESEPGKKDRAKLKLFIENAKSIS